MNLTFYENNKETRNTSITPFIKKNAFPSVFSKFETEKTFRRDSLCLKLAKTKTFLPKYKNIKQEMDKVKKKFRNLFDIKNTIFKEMITKDHSSTYQNFIRGFGRFFFGPFGVVTGQYKYLKEYYYRRSILNAKIYAGKLDYYDYVIKHNRFRQRITNTKKRILSISKNYAIVNDNNDIYSMKAITSKKYFKRKNYVSLNRHRYKPVLTEINEVRPKKYKSIINKVRIKKNSIIKDNMYNPTYLKTHDNFYSYKNKNIYDNYKRAIYKIYDKYYNKDLYKLSTLSNTEKIRINLNTENNIKVSNMDKNDYSGNTSNLFLTQTYGASTHRFRDKKIKFNNISKLRTHKICLNKPLRLKNVSFNI